MWNMPDCVHAKRLDEYVDAIARNAQILQKVLCTLRGIGPQGTWLGSRKLGPGTPEYTWVTSVARIFAGIGIAAKTGGGPGLMEAPHYGCHLAKAPDRAVAMVGGFIGTEDINPYVQDRGWVFTMPDFNTRHDGLLLGSLFHVVLWGRLGTVHEEADLLNRLKHGLLAKAPVYFVERNGYWSAKKSFMTDHVTEDLGPRISPEDYEHTKIVDLFETSPVAFARMVLEEIGFQHARVCEVN